MDPLTQGIFGSTVASCLSKKKNVKKAIVCGFIGGVSPDLDIFIKSASDPLLAVDFHRHFTHSLIFSPIGGFFVSLFIFFFLKKKLSYSQIYLYSFLGYLSHGFLDACTSYGTVLFWPFSDIRVGLNIISIIDPIFTGFLLIFVLTTLLRKSSNLTIKIGLIVSISHLTFNFIKHQQVKDYIKKIASDRNHKIERLYLKPTIGNNFLWRSIYQNNNTYFINAIYYPLFGTPQYKVGSKVKVIDKKTVFPQISANSTHRKDIMRFAYFSQNFIYLHPYIDNFIADLRYSSLPYTDNSLWGIEINFNEPDKHVLFRNIRNFNDKVYNEFWNMLKGDLN